MQCTLLRGATAIPTRRKGGRVCACVCVCMCVWRGPLGDHSNGAVTSLSLLSSLLYSSASRHSPLGKRPPSAAAGNAPLKRPKVGPPPHSRPQAPRRKGAKAKRLSFSLSLFFSPLLSPLSPPISPQRTWMPAATAKSTATVSMPVLAKPSTPSSTVMMRRAMKTATHSIMIMSGGATSLAMATSMPTITSIVTMLSHSAPSSSSPPAGAAVVALAARRASAGAAAAPGTGAAADASSSSSSSSGGGGGNRARKEVGRAMAAETKGMKGGGWGKGGGGGDQAN